VVLDRLNGFLKQHGLYFPVDVATSAQARGRPLDPLRSHGGQCAQHRGHPRRRNASTFWAGTGGPRRCRERRRNRRELPGARPASACDLCTGASNTGGANP
jgi:hypothetical protein